MENSHVFLNNLKPILLCKTREYALEPSHRSVSTHLASKHTLHDPLAEHLKVVRNAVEWIITNMEGIRFGRAKLRTRKMGMEGETCGSGTSDEQCDDVNNASRCRHNEAATSAEHQDIARD